MLAYSFMQNAFIAAFLVSIACGVIGTLTVINRMSFIAGGVAHASYGGIGIAVLGGFSVTLGASVFAILCGVLVGYLSLSKKERSDSIIGAIWAFGMAVGILCLDLAKGYRGDLMGYLFGSILAVGADDIWFMVACDAAILLFVTLFYNQICAVCFDAQFASLRGINSNLIYIILVAFIALCVVVTMQVVGLILVIALLTIPPFIAEKFSQNLRLMMFFSSLISFVCIIAGLLLSYFFDLTTGASVILLLTLIFFLTTLLKR